MDALYATAQVGIVVAVLAILYRPLGDYMAWAFTSPKDLSGERLTYRMLGVDSKREQTWKTYAVSVLAFSALGVVLLYAIQRVQSALPYSLGLPNVNPALAFNTAVSFVTNTNWQSYSPEATLGYSAQMAGLAVQNFLSAAVGIAVAIAVVRGFARHRSATIGNFWVDATRAITRILLPLSILAAIALVAMGVIQNFHGFTDVSTLTGATQTLPGGPVASQEAIKEIGTNGGGFFNANAAHPFENPSPLSSVFQVILLLAIPFALPRTFGRMVGSNRQGYAILAAMATLFVVTVGTLTALEMHGAGTVPQLAGGAMEGKEQRFGVAGSALYAAATTLTSTGSVNSMHDSYTALGGGTAMFNMMLGEVAPGGVGSGLYGMLVLAVLTVFVAGLLVGRTPEYLGHKVGATQIKLVSLYILAMPALVLCGTSLSFAIPALKANVTSTSILNAGNHGLSEVLYAFTSAANNNGSAFAGLTANTGWLNAALGVAMLLGRFVPIVLVLALAGSFAAQVPVPESSGTLPTHRPQFVGMLVAITVIVTALTFFPVLTLGPLAEGIH